MPDPKRDDRSEEMQHDLEELDDHIADARKKLEGRKEAAGIVDEAAGEGPGAQDASGGEDASGATDDVEGAADDAADPAAREPEEFANPT